MCVVYSLWKFPHMLRHIVMDIPGMSRLKNGAGLYVHACVCMYVCVCVHVRND